MPFGNYPKGKYLEGAPLRKALALLASIRQACKGLKGTNAAAYSSHL